MWASTRPGRRTPPPPSITGTPAGAARPAATRAIAPPVTSTSTGAPAIGRTCWRRRSALICGEYSVAPRDKSRARLAKIPG